CKRECLGSTKFHNHASLYLIGSKSIVAMKQTWSCVLLFIRTLPT
ncbi:unnamed protein product, partial [Linum tenue]